MGKSRRFLLSLAALFAAAASLMLGADASPTRIRALPIASRAAAATPLIVEEGDPMGIEPRLAAALAAAKNPDQPVPRPLAALPANDAPIAARIGKDVTLTRRPGVGTPMQIRGERLQERVEVVQSSGGTDSATATARAFLRANRQILGLADPDSEMESRKPVDDGLGYRHVKFAQRYRGLSVWPAELIVHLDARGDVYLLNGSFVFTPKIGTLRPVVQPDGAVRNARASLGEAATARAAAPQLLIYAPGKRASRLAWRVDFSGTRRRPSACSSTPPMAPGSRKFPG